MNDKASISGLGAIDLFVAQSWFLNSSTSALACSAKEILAARHIVLRLR
jgi:hypothetical protein